eukprot:TRINITY_DN10363_c0_g1_i1.p1 TRINITY_DN10363_c0_g1~~TRINITY_DN10363_c0_g1_i1.p1  ORF type:complete len:506 (+),score=154.99 TRINITY_DN10363_c0_g1_i1:112-1629(+)
MKKAKLSTQNAHNIKIPLPYYTKNQPKAINNSRKKENDNVDSKFSDLNTARRLEMLLGDSTLNFSEQTKLSTDQLSLMMNILSERTRMLTLMFENKLKIQHNLFYTHVESERFEHVRIVKELNDKFLAQLKKFKTRQAELSVERDHAQKVAQRLLADLWKERAVTKKLVHQKLASDETAKREEINRMKAQSNTLTKHEAATLREQSRQTQLLCVRQNNIIEKLKIENAKRANIIEGMEKKLNHLRSEHHKVLSKQPRHLTGSPDQPSPPTSAHSNFRRPGSVRIGTSNQDSFLDELSLPALDFDELENDLEKGNDIESDDSFEEIEPPTPDPEFVETQVKEMLPDLVKTSQKAVAMLMSKEEGRKLGYNLKSAIHASLSIHSGCVIDLSCPNCFNPLVDAHIIILCGHSICGDCLNQFLSEGKHEVPCPECGLFFDIETETIPNIVVSNLSQRISALNTTVDSKILDELSAFGDVLENAIKDYLLHEIDKSQANIEEEISDDENV